MPTTRCRRYSRILMARRVALLSTPVILAVAAVYALFPTTTWPTLVGKLPKLTRLEAIARIYDDLRSDLDILRDNAFLDAVEAGDVERAREHLAADAGVNAQYIDAEAFLSAGKTGYTALMYASGDGNADMVKLLLQHLPDLARERDGMSALYFAVLGGHDGVVELLRVAGAKGDPRRIRLTHDLIRAACKGFEMEPGEGFPLYPGVVGNLDGAPGIDEVVRQGADVNWADPNGYTPLMYAANLGLTENVQRLLTLGADVDLKSEAGETALSLTERPDSSVNREERKQVVELLKRQAAKRP
jgi:hypothetical protein